jgi:hypothetical protein
MLLAWVISSLLLPAGISGLLDKAEPGWQLAPTAPQLSAWLAESKLGWEPSLIEADFDGDGRKDYAVQILTKRSHQRVAVFLQRDQGWQTVWLTDDKPDRFTCLALYRKGEKDFDFERMKPFRYAVDSLGVLYSQTTALTFSWKGKGFERRAAPGDEEVEAARAK